MTHIFDRRSFLSGSAAGAALCACGASQAKPLPASKGCWIPLDQTQPYFDAAGGVFSFDTGVADEIKAHSGDDVLDRALGLGLSSLTAEFGVLPAFGFYDEGAAAKNAKATARVALNRADGTVLIGTKLLDNLLSLPSHKDAAILAVCAHEYGHIIANKLGMRSVLDPSGIAPFRSEQFADFICGFYAGRRKLADDDFPAIQFAMQQGRSGGGDHGSGRQRGSAVAEGFRSAFEAKSSTSDGIQAGANFAMAQPEVP